jgi:hypothetical protein
MAEQVVEFTYLVLIFVFERLQMLKVMLVPPFWMCLLGLSMAMMMGCRMDDIFYVLWAVGSSALIPNLKHVSMLRKP